MCRRCPLAANRILRRSVVVVPFSFVSLFVVTTTVTVLLVGIPVVVESAGPFAFGMDQMSTRVVLTKAAQFQGFLGPANIRNKGTSIYSNDPFSYGNYGNLVEIFKGLPYASAPIDSLRYESPLPFPYNSTEVYTANQIKTPCPRFGNETNQYSDPYRSLKKIQNMEDCLYLDIYAPMNTRKDSNNGLPVLVYANSQPEDADDPFDGSSVAAIGNLIVISFRYRVGVLGFLQPGYTDEVRSNFGLWDQLAALQWIKENIKDFGGDDNNVCLMASDLDASLTGVLAFSRMSQAYGGLFHRLILINSSPFSPTTLNQRPLATTVQLARTLKCPWHERDGELLACLRRKPVTQLLKAAQTLGIEDLEYPFAPGLDGTIVQEDLGGIGAGSQVPSSVKETLGRFDLLCGLGHGAVLPANSGRAMWQGIGLERFVTAAIKLALRLEAGAKPTGNLKQQVIQAIQNDYEENPLMRELISDFLVVNPMVQLLDAHSEGGKNTFFYVSKDYDPMGKGKHNEVSYIFSNQIYQWKYVDRGKPNMDLHAFEVFINLIANFVRSGDPNVATTPGDRYSSHQPQQQQQQRSWPKYKKNQGRYLSFGQDPELKSKYRHTQTNFWSHIFPALLAQFAKTTYPNELNNWQTGSGAPPFFGRGGRFPNLTHIYPADGDSTPSTTTSSMTQPTVILIGCLLLLLNVLCFMGLFYQRERLKQAELRLRKRFMENEEQEESQRRAAGNSPNDTQEQTELELDSQASGPYVARGDLNLNYPPVHPPTNPHSIPLSLDALSETETDNGFGPDFLGPNYDPRTKVSRWMFQQQNREGSLDRPPSPTPIPMHVDVRSLQRPPPGNLLTLVPAFQPPFHTGSDIPYADSRATSPSISQYCEFPPPYGNTLLNNPARRSYVPSPLAIQEYPSLERRGTPTTNRTSITLPVRNSMIVREVDDSVESSEPKLVPVKTGTLTRSVGVGSRNPSGSEVELNGGKGSGTLNRHPHGTIQKVTFADGL